MGELLKYNQIAKLSSEIFMDNEEGLTWLQSLDRAKEIYEKYERGVGNGSELDGTNVIYSKK